MIHARLVLALVLPLALAASCSLPTDERATPYDPDNLPAPIANTTTTSTTTTTTTTTVTPITGETLDPPPSTTTTTNPPTATAPVDLFYTIGISDDLARLKRDLNADASVQQVIEQLESPLPDVAEFSLRTAVRRGMIEDVLVERGTATVVLNQNTVDSLPDTTLQRAIAQLVLTLTSFRTPDAGAIGKVRFEVDGEGFAVFVPAFGGASEPGEAVAFSDFASLIENDTPPTTSITTSTTTTTAPTEVVTTEG